MAAWCPPRCSRARAPKRSRASWWSSPVATTGLDLQEHTVNGQPGLVGRQDGATVTVFAFDVAEDRITRIWAVRNPDKLRPWNAI